MHTVLVIGGGLAMLAACLALGQAWGGAAGLRIGALVSLPLWFIGAFVNMWIGTRHGYSWGQEFPIFLGVFAVPALIAGAVWWKMS